MNVLRAVSAQARMTRGGHAAGRTGRGRARAVVIGALALSAFALAPATIAQGAVGFQPPVSYATGAGTLDVAVGDFNKDGRPDVATANGSDASFSILLGDADGTFAAAATTPLGVSPGSIATADFDGDGNLDLVLAAPAADQAIVYWGTGTGTGFDATRTIVATASTPTDAIGSDLDGDGRADLIVADSTINIAVFLTDPLIRGFGAATRTQVGVGVVGLAAGAVFGAAPQDVVVALRDAGVIRMQIGDGTGGWSTGGSYGVGGTPPGSSAPNGIALADITGDGRLDAVTSNAGTDNVTILAWRAAGILNIQQNTALPVGSSPSGIATGDFTGDGVDDAAVVARGSGKVVVLDSGGALAPMHVVGSYDAGSSPLRAASGDFNGDGADDLVVADDGSGVARVLLSQGAPELTGQASTSVAVGGALGDTVTLAGATPTVTGTITFRLYGPDDATCSASPLATQTRTVSGNGDYTASAVTAPHAGTYRWVVSYSGDDHNDPVADGCADANQSTVVTKAVTTVASAATSPITAGQAAPASATLAGGHSPTGTVVLKAYTTPDCSGSAAYTSNALTVSGNGSYAATPAFTPASAGTYRWVASYGGDGDNAAAASACGAAGASTVVGPAAPALATTASAAVALPSGALHARATLSGGAHPSGTIRFRLYGPGDATCGGAPAFTDTVAVTGAGVYDSASFTPTAAGAYRWVASYSGDGDNDAAASGCGDAGAAVDVAKAAQTIGFPPLPDRQLGDPDAGLGATASSGLAVAYASTTPGVCTVSGDTVHAVAVGACSITASQPGDATHMPAPDVVRSFAVTDGGAPVLELPAPISVVASGATTPVTWTATAADAVDGPVPVSCSPASGHAFPVGTTTVSCTATDVAGNRTTGSFTVTVTPALAVRGVAVTPRAPRLARGGSVDLSIAVRLTRAAPIAYQLQRRTNGGWRTVAAFRRSGRAGVNRAIARLRGSAGDRSARAATTVLGTVRVRPGRHQIRVTAGSAAPATATFTVRAAQRVVFTG
jgi:FG-GAP-like repeat/HYR domain